MRTPIYVILLIVSAGLNPLYSTCMAVCALQQQQQHLNTAICAVYNQLTINYIENSDLPCKALAH